MKSGVLNFSVLESESLFFFLISISNCVSLFFQYTFYLSSKILSLHIDFLYTFHLVKWGGRLTKTKYIWRILIEVYQTAS